MSDGFITAISAVTNAIFLLAGIYVYLALVRQIIARPTVERALEERTFGFPDVILAAILSTLFLLNAATAVSHDGKMVLRTNDLIFNGLISGAVFILIVAFLKIRGRDVNSLGGFSRLGFWRTFLTGTILIFAAYPFILLADLVTQRVLGGASSKQGIVELFTNSQTLEQRVLIIVLATAVAPIVEEFVFRFFLYGVLRRYVGRFAGLIINAALFAAVHAHLPSAAPLFVLGACFTLAYEWSGSILVSMTMHSLFNAFSLIALAFPELFPQ
ncbi:MAG: CPBP family intramembrane metalloprotease [Verrucomicrobiota bacterium]|nr:CPBP family intramembrane metalloprotease [Verrucomicrobiota bacterium]